MLYVLPSCYQVNVTAQCTNQNNRNHQISLPASFCLDSALVPEQLAPFYAPYPLPLASYHISSKRTVKSMYYRYGYCVLLFCFLNND